MTTERVLTESECEKAISFMRRCASRGEAVTWEHAIRYSRFARDDPRDDDEYDDRDRPHRPRTKPLRLTDADSADDDDSTPRPRVVKEPVVTRPRQDDDDTDDDTDNRPARRLPARQDDDDRRPGSRSRRRQVDAVIEQVGKEPCASCGKRPAGSVQVRHVSADEDRDLDGDHEDPESRSYLVPMCQDCKGSDDADEVGETELHKRHSRGQGDCNRYSRAVRLAAEVRNRRDR
jgi:hypothetical protein